MHKFRCIGLLVLLIGSVILLCYAREVLCDDRVIPVQQDSGSQETHERIAFLDRMVSEENPIILDNRHVTDAVAFLRFQYRCPISVEIIEFEQKDRTLLEGRRWISKNRPLVNRSFSNLTVRQLLDELARIDPGYHWKVYDGRYVVFGPRTKAYGGTEKSGLDGRISVSATDVPLTTLLSSAHPFGRELMHRHGLGFAQLTIGRGSELHKISLSVHLQNVTVRDAFNTITGLAEAATAFDDFCVWAVQGRKITGPDATGKVVTVRDFFFHRFSKYKHDEPR